MDVSLAQWMALTPTEPVKANLEIDRVTLNALWKDRKLVVQEGRRRAPDAAPPVSGEDLAKSLQVMENHMVSAEGLEPSTP